MPATFDWYELRTTDLDGAARFYGDVLGRDLRAELTLLPERARAAGAPPHWLGHVHVADLPAAIARVLAAGGEQRGPVRGDVAALRDPHGAALGLRTGPARASDAVTWHELHVTDAAAALATYRELFGWEPGDVIDLGPPLGAYRTFTAGPASGAMVGSARQPHIHTHWNFYFAVADLDAALDRVRTLGGTVIGEPRALPGGRRGAACEDAQRAAFALASTS